MKTAEIRQAFFDYFIENGHELVPSSPLVPVNDPTLLFTNAGMVQFKEVFLGLDNRSYDKATSSQCCVRAGGKHNDLENVGYTARHHTFFEMLGNFSFGDYFKREAIAYAWEFLTQVMKLPPEKLWVTVYQDDKEAEDIWLKEMKVDPHRFTRCGDKDNFWSMGDTGPCGPCTEIFYDHGATVKGGPPGTPEEDGDRFVEIWNLVFMQYDRDKDGVLHPLPKPSVDTGMGLERIAAVMQGVHSNYDIDLFQDLIKAAASLTNCKELTNNSLKVIADHIRTCGFLICEGIVPSNEGRGYVLRRIIRRAIRHGNVLNQHEPFLYKLATTLAQVMGAAYPILKDSLAIIEKVLLKEEQQFANTLDQGLKILEADIADLKGKVISGDTVFKLYDTYGFPIDLTADIARERGLQVDSDGFERAMQQQRSQSQAASQFVSEAARQLDVKGHTKFGGYDAIDQLANITQILKQQSSVDAVQQGQEAIIVLDASPFYAESGGQVGDTGELVADKNIFQVTDTQKQGKTIIHIGLVTQGAFKTGQQVHARVDGKRRYDIRLNHTATHLLHAALREVLGKHVIQKGSLVEARRLRFDFTHYEPMTTQQIREVEALVNYHIRENHPVQTEIKTPDEAKKEGAMALFGEKYDEQVRVLSMSDFSKELCGGTHAKRSGDIGIMKIISETGTAAGVRRIEAVTGNGALKWINNLEAQLSEAAGRLKTHPDQLATKVSQLLENKREMEKELDRLHAKLATSSGTDLSEKAQEVNGIKVLATTLPGVKPNSLRDTIDQLKNKLGSAVIVLASVDGDRVNVAAGITKDCIGKTPSAKDLVVAICGKGGGRDDMAQGGGELPDDLDERLARIKDMVAEKT